MLIDVFDLFVHFKSNFKMSLLSKGGSVSRSEQENSTVFLITFSGASFQVKEESTTRLSFIIQLSSSLKGNYYYRPPSKGWGKVIFSVCSHLRRGGTPSQVWVGGYPISGLGRGVPGPRSGGVPSLRPGGDPIPGLGGYPIPGPGGGVPHPRSR